MCLVNRQEIKDINEYIRSISPASVEKICINLKLQGIDKDVWLLRYRDHCSINEVAEKLNVSVATINRTIIRLKTMMALELIELNKKV
jgi:predicted transcriptional regulator